MKEKLLLLKSKYESKVSFLEDKITNINKEIAESGGVDSLRLDAGVSMVKALSMYQVFLNDIEWAMNEV